MTISELVQFDGGLSTKTAQHLIGRNEGIICQNVDLEKGTLYPLSSLSFIDTVVGKHMYVFNSKLITNIDASDDRFYDEYGGRLYWSNDNYGSVGLKRYSYVNPSDYTIWSSVTAYVTGDIVKYTYNSVDYALYALQGSTNQEPVYPFDDAYWVDASLNGITADAPSPYPQSTAPVTISTSVFDGQLSNAEYTYALTVVDTNGIESIPVIIGSATATSNKSIKLCVDSALYGTYVPSQFTVNVYRTGGDNPTFNLIVDNLTPSHPSVVIEGSNICYYDKLADINVSRIELTTFENYTPPTELDMLIELKGTFFASSGKRVYFSQTGRPEFWHPLDYVDLDKDCTGLGKFGDSVIAFTRTSAYMITGYNRDNIALQRLPFNQGCVSKHSVVNIDAYLVWTSLNGICLFDGAQIQVITKKTLAWDEFNRIGNAVYDDFNGTNDKWDGNAGFNITYATGYQDKYYGVFSNGIMILDLSNGLKVSSIYAENVSSISLNRDDNFLYISIDNLDGTYDVYATLETGSSMTATWKTGRLTDGTVNVKKQYRRVILDGLPVSVDVFIDGVSRFKIENKDSFFLPSGLVGHDIQFEINTVNEIRGLKYEYTQLKA